MLRIFSLFLLFGLIGLDDSAAWTVDKIKGEATVVSTGSSGRLQEGQELHDGDLVKTSRGSRVRLKEGDSKLWVGARSHLKIHKNLKPNSKSKGKVLELLVGKIRAKIKPKEARRYLYKTKTAVAGVRGTEFFIQNENDKEFFCTLEGNVVATLSDGKEVEVKEGLGLILSAGESPQLAANDSFLVDEWLAQTSFGEVPTVEFAYHQEAVKHAVGENLYAGGFGWAQYCSTKNPDYDGDTDDSSRDCARAYLSPFLQWGKRQRLYLRPALVVEQRNPQQEIDGVPKLFGAERTTLTVAEAYWHQETSELTYRVGFQEVHWADGILLSGQRFSPEPRTHLAARLMWRFGDYGFEALATQGIKGTKPLDGHTHIQVSGLRLDLPSHWGSFYALHFNYGGFGETSSSVYKSGHEIGHIGFYSKKKFRHWDYQWSSIFQKHFVHIGRHGHKEHRPTAGMVDLDLGYYFGGESPWRLSARYIFADRNFLNGFEDYYAFGLSGLVAIRANFEQKRLQAEWKYLSTQKVFVEWLQTTEVSDNGFVRQNAIPGDGRRVADEIDLVFQSRWSDRVETLLGAFVFAPEGISVGPRAAAYGVNTRVSFRY